MFPNPSRPNAVRPYKIEYSQNFLRSTTLTQQLVAAMHLDPHDTIIEIGPGTGTFTKALAAKVRKVLAVEYDTTLATQLEQQFSSSSKVAVINADFLQFKLPTQGKYKVVGNIPFGLTADIVRKLLVNQNPPTDAFLIMQQEAAARLLCSHECTLFGLQFYPWFNGKILRKLASSDFCPMPGVSAVLVHLQKRSPPLLDAAERLNYLDFIAFNFQHSKSTSASALKKLFTVKQFERLMAEHGVSRHATPSQLSPQVWLEFWQTYAKLGKRNLSLLKGCYRKLQIQQRRIIKMRRTRVSKAKIRNLNSRKQSKH